MNLNELTYELVSDEARPFLRKLDGALNDRTVLHEYIGGRAENLTRDYLTAIAATRHATANRLKATPTGHLERAAESVTHTADKDAAEVTVTSPGITRAFNDITITPGAGKKYLTIPATAEAYGNRAGAFNDLRLAFFKGGKLLALVKAQQSSLADRKESGGEVYYWLKKSVHQAQDRKLLPSDALYVAAAEEGAADYLRALNLALVA